MTRRRGPVVALVAVFAAGCAGAPAATGPTVAEPAARPSDGPPPLVVRRLGCDDVATIFGERPGARFAVACPAGCVDGALWGTDVYTSDSRICVAAVHAGVLDAARGGDVIVELAAGEAAYAASVRHGVASAAWGAWALSFGVRVPGDTPIVHETGGDGGGTGDGGDGGGGGGPGGAHLAHPLTCHDTAGALAGGPGARHHLVCPPGCTSGPVWGTRVYTDDSAICVAAVHAGVLVPIAGGAVVVTVLGGLPSYAPSTAHGVTSGAWGFWARSYLVARP